MKMFAKKPKNDNDRKAAGDSNRRNLERDGEDEEDTVFMKNRNVRGLGNAGRWVRTKDSGALYVLTNTAILRVSVGGADDLSRKRRNAKAFARLVLKWI